MQIYHPRAMGQRLAGFSRRIFSLIFVSAIVISGCDRQPTVQSPASQPTPATKPSYVTVASLVPAATDLILGMGAGEQLVAVSNWDAERPEIQKLPRVGDYRSIDWEKLSTLGPNVMIVQFRADKVPPGLSERAAELGVALVNVKNNRLSDLYETLDVLGDALKQRDKSDAAKTQIKSQLETIQRQVAGKPPVRTLLLRTAGELASVGGGNFLDELLTIAGGRNVLEGGDNSYPTLDRERLLALDPDVILYLLPGASPQVIEQAHASLASLAQLKAVRNKRVHVLTESYLLLPGYIVPNIARRFAELLHPAGGS
jgi:iron complex transport system substrate-binding protein